MSGMVNGGILRVTDATRSPIQATQTVRTTAAED